MYVPNGGFGAGRVLNFNQRISFYHLLEMFTEKDPLGLGWINPGEYRFEAYDILQMIHEGDKLDSILEYVHQRFEGGESYRGGLRAWSELLKVLTEEIEVIQR